MQLLPWWQAVGQQGGAEHQRHIALLDGRAFETEGVLLNSSLRIEAESHSNTETTEILGRKNGL